MSWNGVKKQTHKQEIEVWCKDVGIRNYTINSKGEIDVDGGVNLNNNDFEELPYKFGIVKGYFDIGDNPNLISLKNCPNEVGYYFRCSYCPKLDSLKGCPKEVGWKFFCRHCKRKFTEEEVMSLCNVKKINIGV